jgi:hypothetical protein
MIRYSVSNIGPPKYPTALSLSRARVVETTEAEKLDLRIPAVLPNSLQLFYLV